LQAIQICQSVRDKVDSEGTAAVAAASSGCRPGFKNSGGPDPCSLNESSKVAENTQQIAATANQSVATSCGQALEMCEKNCQAAASFHKNRSDTAPTPDTRIAEHNLELKAVENLKQCHAVMDPIVKSTGIQAWQVGLAAAAAGGVFLITQSGGKDDSASSQGSNTEEKGDDGLITDPVDGSDGSSSGEEWIRLEDLGHCSEFDKVSRPDCFDKLNGYCLQKAPQYRLKDYICAEFCRVSVDADSCQMLSIQPANNTASTSSSDSNQNSSQTTGQKNCSDPQMIHLPECLGPMTSYCSKYGLRGAGCAQFCEIHKGVCKN
ncbi:MAG: hypothetical protein KDD35_11705, partial [Bdellovibrionales bacterium]|nr:hypothetical protein [Bdellovibrionales bacterium]